MGDVVQKMGEHMPESFLWLCVFLSTNLTVPPLHYRAAIQTIIFFSKRSMTHLQFFLKINKKPLTAFLFSYTLFKLFLN